MTRVFYFTGGAIGAIAFSNFLGTVSRFFPQARSFALLFLAALVAVGLVAAWAHDEPEESFRIWAWFLFFVIAGVGFAFK
jgi:hypothetical protein